MERMGALLVGAGPRLREQLEPLMAQMNFCILAACPAEEARAACGQLPAALVLIHFSKQATQADLGLSRHVAEHTSATVIVLVRPEQRESVRALSEEFGVLVLEKPVNRQTALHALCLSRAAQRRIDYLRRENQRLQQKMEEIKIIDRAKCALIQVLHMTETQAHHFIERQAMDTRNTRYEVAIRILKTYED